jgi:hypothetical protein
LTGQYADNRKGPWIGHRLGAQAATGGVAMDTLTGIALVVVIAVVVIAGIRIMQPEK